MSEPSPSEPNGGGDTEETNTNVATLAKIVQQLGEIMALCKDNQTLTQHATAQLRAFVDRIAPSGKATPRKVMTSKKMMVEIEKKKGIKMPVKFLREFTVALSQRHTELKVLKPSFRRDDLFKLLDDNIKQRTAFFEELKVALDHPQSRT